MEHISSHADKRSLIQSAADGYIPSYAIVMIVAGCLFCVVWSPALIKKLYERIHYRSDSRTQSRRHAAEQLQRRLRREARREYVASVLITKRVSVGVNSQQSSLNAENSDGDRCAICLASYSNGLEICLSHNPQCRHQYCKPCIMKWLMRNEDCPVCRRPFLSLGDPTEASTPQSTDGPPLTVDLEQPSNPLTESPTFDDSSMDSLSIASVVSEASLALPNYRPLSDDESCSTGIGSTSSLPRPTMHWFFGRRTKTSTTREDLDEDDSESSIESREGEQPLRFQWKLPYHKNDSSTGSDSEENDDVNSTSSVPLPIKWTMMPSRPRLNSDPGYSTSDANDKSGSEYYSSSDDDEEREAGFEVDYFPEAFATNVFVGKIADTMGTDFPPEFNPV